MKLLNEIQDVADQGQALFVQLVRNYKQNAQVARNTMNKLITDDVEYNKNIYNECSFIAQFSAFRKYYLSAFSVNATIPKDFKDRYPAYCEAFKGEQIVKVENFYFPAFLFDETVHPVRVAQFTRQIVHHIRVEAEQKKINEWSVMYSNRDVSVSQQIQELEKELRLLREWNDDVNDYRDNWRVHPRYQKKATLLARKPFQTNKNAGS